MITISLPTLHIHIQIQIHNNKISLSAKNVNKIKNTQHKKYFHKNNNMLKKIAP